MYINETKKRRLSIYIPPFASIDWFQNIYEKPSAKIPARFRTLFSYPKINRVFCLISKYANSMAMAARKMESKLILNAGDPTGRREKIFAPRLKAGYEGGCPIPSVYALVIVSGESSFLNAGYAVNRYI
jgi:hypothetical protein